MIIQNTNVRLEDQVIIHAQFMQRIVRTVCAVSWLLWTSVVITHIHHLICWHCDNRIFPNVSERNLIGKLHHMKYKELIL